MNESPVTVYRFILHVLLMILFLPLNITAKAPALREQICLNGLWPKGGTVPQYGGISKMKEQTFERDVTVPASWEGKVYKLEFGAVNFIANIYINDKHVFEHVGGWIPFTLDITQLTQPGKTFRLKVNVKDASFPPVSNGKESYNWPVGGWRDKGGISDDVWLRAYGKVYIDDSFIKTSFEKNKYKSTIL